jgi:GNAT superfamily N-acetyltransferase
MEPMKSKGSAVLPPGFKLIPVKTIYLEMKERPRTEPVAMPGGCEVRRWERPAAEEYRALFTAVGAKWGWSGRLILREDELLTIIQAESTEIHRLRCEGKTAGFVELNRCVLGDVEIAYFGLLPAFIGRGLGRFLLDWTVRRAWEGKTECVWLHTCEFDHPQALAAYVKAGFRAYDEKTETQPYPEGFSGSVPPAGG